MQLNDTVKKPYPCSPNLSGQGMIKFRSLITLLVTLAAGATIAVAQPRFLDKPVDMTLMPGQRVSISLSVDTGTLNQNTAFVGEHPDASNPLPDTALVNVAGTVTFFAPPAVETTSYWLRICGDLGCDETQTFTLFVEGGVTGPPAPFEDAEELGEDWFRLDWLGDFNIAFFPWIFHAQHSWMFVFDGSTAESVFLFDLASGAWFFTNTATYPNLYSFGRNSWVFYFEGTSGPREFVDLISGDFFSLD